MIIWTLFLIAGFSGFVIYHQQRLFKVELSRVETHAKVISASLWTYEKQTPIDYLALAADANDYLRVTVTDDNGTIFVEIKGRSLVGRDRFFHAIRLVHVHRFESAITYEGRTIGVITVDWVCRTLYLYLYILFCIVLLLIGIGLYLQLLDAKKTLEKRVRQRTADLEKEVKERQNAEIELRYQTQRLSMHVKHSPLGVIEWSEQFNVVEWNKAAEDIFGFTREEMLGRKPFGVILPPEEDGNVNKIWSELVSGRGGQRSINTNLTKSGEIRTCSWFNTVLVDGNANVIGVGSLVQDITEQVKAEQKNKMLQQQLLQSQKMEAVGNLAGGIAHDFNNLLQSISGFTQLLLFDCEKENDRRRLEGVEKSAQRAADLVRQLLTFSRKIESNLIPLNINREISNMRAILDRTIPKMVDIRMELDPDLSDIMGDPVQLEQILLNLAINANHAMPDGGILTIETSNTVLDTSFCSEHLGTREGPNVLLQVRDTGAGMDSDTVERIFEPFFTTKEVDKGTGLGLSTVYGIIVEHGAYIDCQSELGKGTVFRMFFPVAGQQAGSLPENGKQEPDVLPNGTETVLIVDDEENILELGRDMLGGFGYTVLTAASGEEAIEVCRHKGKSLDIIVMDLNMPGMGGFKCMEQLKQIGITVPILVASGFTPAESVDKATKIGADGFIHKPFRLTDLLKIIRETLDS